MEWAQLSWRGETTQGLNKMLFIRTLIEKASSSWVCCLRPQLPPDSLDPITVFVWFGRSAKWHLIKWVLCDTLGAKGDFTEKPTVMLLAFFFLAWEQGSKSHWCQSIRNTKHCDVSLNNRLLVRIKCQKDKLCITLQADFLIWARGDNRGGIRSPWLTGAIKKKPRVVPKQKAADCVREGRRWASLSHTKTNLVFGRRGNRRCCGARGRGST